MQRKCSHKVSGTLWFCACGNVKPRAGLAPKTVAGHIPIEMGEAMMAAQRPNPGEIFGRDVDLR